MERAVKKHMVALAALVATGAMAQSTVTIWGIVDTAVTWGNGSLGDRTQLTNSGLLPSQLGFRGVEDLGGGMKAGFWLEAWVNSDNGTGQSTNTNNQATGSAGAGLGGGQGLTFNRRSTLSLGGEWGELRLGREYTPQLWNLTVYDPFLNLGVGTSQTLLSSGTITTAPAVRASNSVTYLYGHGFNNTSNGGPGFHAMGMYYMGENASNAPNSKDGTGYGARVGYIGGPFTVALALSKTNYLTGDAHQNNLGASYDFGVAKIVGHITQDKLGTVSGKGYLVGGNVPAGAGYFRVAYSHYRLSTATSPESDKLALGYVHNLSKRTAIYGTAALVRNSGGAAVGVGGALTAANESANGFDLGIKHSF